MKRLVIALIAAGLIAVGVLGNRLLQLNGAPTAAAETPHVATTTSTSGNLTAASIDAATEHAYAVAGPSVVYIENVGTGSGSGVIYDSNGDIVTNNHVVSGASTLRVTLSDGRSFPATLVGTDPADDLAVVRIHASNLKAATFGKAHSYQVAQMVLAIGSPLGLKSSVTSGLISGLDRVEQEPSGAYLPNAIQTSAPINPGNSGGALVTLGGVVVGMPTLEQTSAQNGAAAQAIGFAVPSERIMSVANQIIATGKVEHTGRAYLGISPADPSAQGLGQGGGGFGFSPPSGGQVTAGALVQQIISNGPAAQAGIQQGDIITSASGTSVSSAEDLLTILAQKKPGDTISLEVNRNGNTQTVQVHLGELPG